MTDTVRKCPQCGSDLLDDAPAGLCPKCLLAVGIAGNSGPSESPSWGAQTTPLPGSSHFVPPTPEALTDLFPQLEIIELIGAGGMGAVYKARQPGLDRLVAVKILPPEVGADPSFAQRFSREAQALARLGHQNIIAVYDFGVARGLYYFIMEYVDGANLRHLIHTGELAPAEALAIVPQICEALQFAHDEGIVHRDIKPENILIDKKGRVKIADFGLARMLGKEASELNLTATHQVLGTLHYMAPEQLQGLRNVDHRADIYSLGVVFYEMLTGDLPLGRFAPPSQKVEVDVRLDEIVLRSLENKPERRYQQASLLKSDIEVVRSSSAVAATNSQLSEAELEAVVLAKLPEGRLAAIKAYRERTGDNLAEATRAVESVAEKHGIKLSDVSAARRTGVLFGLLLAVIGPIFIAVLSRRFPELQIDVGSGLIAVGFLAWLGYCAWEAARRRGTPPGWSSSLVFLGNLMFLFVWLAVKSQPILDALNRLTGSTPGRSDAAVLMAISLGQLLWILPQMFRLARRLQRVPTISVDAQAISDNSKKNWWRYRRSPAAISAAWFILSAMNLLVAAGGYFGSGSHWVLYLLLACNFFGLGLASLPRRSQGAATSDQATAAPKSPSERLHWPAILLIVAGIVDFAEALFFGLVVVAIAATRPSQPTGPGEYQTQAIGFLLGYAMFGAVALVAGVMRFAGGMRMRQLRSYAFVSVASVTSLLPVSVGAFLGVPAAVWALLSLRRTDVKEAFRGNI